MANTRITAWTEWDTCTLGLQEIFQVLATGSYFSLDKGLLMGASLLSLLATTCWGDCKLLSAPLNNFSNLQFESVMGFSITNWNLFLSCPTDHCNLFSNRFHGDFYSSLRTRLEWESITLSIHLELSLWFLIIVNMEIYSPINKSEVFLFLKSP